MRKIEDKGCGTRWIWWDENQRIQALCKKKKDNGCGMGWDMDDNQRIHAMRKQGARVDFVRLTAGETFVNRRAVSSVSALKTSREAGGAARL